MITGFGFGRRTGIDLPGESPGIVHPVSNWSRIAKAYISFGQGISVTPLQLANAFAALANGGVVHQPYLVRAIGRDGAVEETKRPDRGGTRDHAADRGDARARARERWSPRAPGAAPRCPATASPARPAPPRR